MIDSFASTSGITLREDGAFDARFDSSWYQGRGAFGGLVAALFARAFAAKAGDDGRPLRTLTCHFCAPALAGPARIEVEIPRASSAVSHLTARMIQEDGVVAIATATRARARAVGVAFCDRRMPEAPTFEATPALDLVGVGPAFSRYFDFRFAHGSAPFSMSSQASFGGWVRHHNPGALDAALAAAYADAWMPAVFTRFAEVRPCATVTLTYHFFTDFLAGVEVEPGDPVLVTSRSDILADGYAEQSNEVWTRSGALVMTGTQLIAVIR
ncbi:MAG: thioesterase family protein [Byssovorax sp.]